MILRLVGSFDDSLTPLFCWFLLLGESGSGPSFDITKKTALTKCRCCEEMQSCGSSKQQSFMTCIVGDSYGMIRYHTPPAFTYLKTDPNCKALHRHVRNAPILPLDVVLVGGSHDSIDH